MMSLSLLAGWTVVKELKYQITSWIIEALMPRSHIHRSPRRLYYRLNFTDDPENAYFRSTIWMHYISMIKYYYV